MNMLPPRSPGRYKRSTSPRPRTRSPRPPRNSLRSSSLSSSSEKVVSNKSPRASYPGAIADEISNTSCTTLEEKKEEEVGPGTKFHEAMEDRDWAKLEILLKKYDAKYWKRVRQRAEQAAAAAAAEGSPKSDEDQQASSPPQAAATTTTTTTTPPASPVSVRRSRAYYMLKFLPSPAGRAEKEKSLVPPLLTKDHQGRTPLHLAFLNRCPEKYIVQLIIFERTAAGVQDIFGRVPLHIAVEKKFHDHILEKLIKGHPNGLKTKDLQGRSPVGLAVELARQGQDEDSPEDPEHPFHWGTPKSTEEEDWQFKQEKIWNKVTFLLKELMKRNKCVIPSEHGLILEALEGGAPPKTINRFISTADKYLVVDDDLAGSAIALCIKRRYCLDTLEYLLDSCRERTTMITDYTHKALVTFYRIGCFPQKEGVVPYGKELIDAAQNRGEEKTEEGEENEKNDINNDTTMANVSDACKEWWDTMKHLIYYCAYGKAFKSIESLQEQHLLHAALATAATPPSLVQLILVLYPNARSILCPVFKVLPIHIMCTRWKHDILHKEKDVTMERVIKHFLKPERQLLSRRHRGRLPIHLALDVGQAWSFVKPFVSLDKKALGMRDPHSKLFPFQMAAVKLSPKNIAMFLRNQYTPGEWRVISTAEKRHEYTLAENAAVTRQVGTIYELLRRHPDAIAGRVLSRDVKFSKDLEGVGPISKHYLSWVYGRGSRGWKLRPGNVKVLRDSILNANISKALTPWWDRLKHHIWESSKNDSLPQTDDYLLHAALYNPDTPPLVIELLLELFPMSAAKVVPGTDIYPLHIASATTSYHPQPFEIPNHMNNLRLTLLAYKSAVRLKLHGRLPLHICIARGKTWSDMKPLVQLYRQSLMIVDPQTGLAPFQLMSIFKMTSKEHSLRFSNIAARHAREVDMDSMGVREKARFLRNIKKKQDLDVVTSIYELLRMDPNAIYAISQHGTATRDAASIALFKNVEEVWTTETIEEEEESYEEEVVYEEEEVYDETTELNESKLLGVAATLEKFLQDIERSPSRRETIRDYVLSPEKQRKTLGSFFQQTDDARSLITPRTSGRPSLSAFLNDGTGTGARSLVSRTSAALHDDFVKPNYDDDVMSNMGASAASSFVSLGNSDSSLQWSSTTGSVSNTNRTPISIRGPRRRSSPKPNGKMMPKLPIALPDLGIDDDK